MMAAGKGDAAKGKVVFGYCTSCHNADSTEKKSGPGLKGLYKKDKLNNGKKPADASVKARIEEGGGGMPPYREMLSEAEKEDLLAYLRTL
jgi:mono/diheme cytochrome c family protein